MPPSCPIKGRYKLSSTIPDRIFPRLPHHISSSHIILSSRAQQSAHQRTSTISRYNIPLLFSTRPFSSRLAPRHSSAPMATTGLDSAQCRDHVVFARTFWHHSDAAMVILVIGTFAIPGLYVLLKTISAIPKDESHNSHTAHDTSKNSRLSISPKMLVAKLVGSTILLGLTACIFTFQMLFALFTRYCIHGIVHEFHVAFVFMVAAIGAIFVLLGVVLWLVITVTFARKAASWCWNNKRRAIQLVREPVLADVKNTSPSDELQRRDEHVVGQEDVNYPASTLPPYMV